MKCRRYPQARGPAPTIVQDREAGMVVNDALAESRSSKPDLIQRRCAGDGAGLGVVSEGPSGRCTKLPETIPIAVSFFGANQDIRVGAGVPGSNHFRHPDENEPG